MLVDGRKSLGEFSQMISALVAATVDLLQLRDHNLDDAQLIAALAQQIIQVGALLIATASAAATAPRILAAAAITAAAAPWASAAAIVRTIGH